VIGALLGLFASAFLAATILPFYSEVILFVLLQQGFPALALVLVATLGNTLGAAVNWWLGKWLLRFENRKWFYFSHAQVQKAQHWFNRYGLWSLCFAWLPIGGDALTLVAGIMRVRFSLFLLLVGLGKGLRYVAVVLFSNQVQGL
jgi:membrane protein YqaA with SNARE-associated domain